jgi:hypothetical protein
MKAYRELQLQTMFRGPDGTTVGAIKYDEKSQVYERQGDSYVVRYLIDPDHEYLIPLTNIRAERRVRPKSK